MKRLKKKHLYKFIYILQFLDSNVTVMIRDSDQSRISNKIGLKFEI